MTQQTRTSMKETFQGGSKFNDVSQKSLKRLKSHVEFTYSFVNSLYRTMEVRSLISRSKFCLRQNPSGNCVILLFSGQKPCTRII